MPIIILTTSIHAPIEHCFDLARSIDLHVQSTKQTGERAIAGVTSGLIGLNQSVTWRAKHFGIWQQLTSKITDLDPPYFFADEMIKGAFHSFRHEHHFKLVDGITVMTDQFDYVSPLGKIGRLADWLFLKRYMTNLLTERNRVIKTVAEQSQTVK